jgi:Tol biopolymer transport system component
MIPSVDQGLLLVNADGTGQQKILDAVQTADLRRHRFQWSPSGARILFLHEPRGDNAGDPADVWVVNRDGSDPKKIVQGDAARWMPPDTGGYLLRRMRAGCSAIGMDQ